MNNPTNNNYFLELKRKFSVVDELLNAHCLLHDRYRLLSVVFDTIILLTAIILNATVFADSIFNRFDIQEQYAKDILGIVSISMLCLTIFTYTFNIKQKLSEHKIASESLANIKSKLRLIQPISNQSDNNRISTDGGCEFEKLLLESEIVLRTIPHISEKQLTKFIINRKRKLNFMKIMNNHPNIHYFVGWWAFCITEHANFIMPRRNSRNK